MHASNSPRTSIKALLSTPRLRSGSAGLYVAAGLAAIYLIWGSTYLGVRYAIETLPPLVMAGMRVTTAGLILYGWTRLRGAARPSAAHWRDAALLGGLLLLGGNGSVAWAEQYVPSGLAALVGATVPLWIVLLDWIRPGGERPTRPVALGVGLGLLGMVLLVGPAHLLGGTALHLVGVTVIVLGTLSWSIGSLYSRRANLPPVPLQSTAMQLLTGGAWLFLAAALTGDWGRLDLAAISVRSLLALSYLVVMGSIVGFNVYLWLMRTTSPALASTYAYVNPVVAMFLGWALAAESLTWQTLVAASIIISGVALITLGRWRR
jgi:drug/metabolite transporter (DMT)-like permease